MNVELLGRVSQRLLALMAASATFALKAGLWFRPILPGSSTHSPCSDFPSHLLVHGASHPWARRSGDIAPFAAKATATK